VCRGSIASACAEAHREEGKSLGWLEAALERRIDELTRLLQIVEQQRGRYANDAAACAIESAVPARVRPLAGGGAVVGAINLDDEL